MRASRRLHSSPLLNMGYNLAEKKKMMFARFILWDMSGAVKRENRSVETLGVQRTKSFAWVLGCASGVGFLRDAMPSHFTVAIRVGAGVVLGGVGTLASPLAEGCLVCMRCGVRRATQASPPVFLGVQGDASVPTQLHTTPAPTRTNTPSPTTSRKTYPRAQSSNIRNHSM